MNTGWVRYNFCGKQKFLRKKLFRRQFPVALIYSTLAIFITMKISNNSRMKSNRTKEVRLIIFAIQMRGIQHISYLT